MLYALRIFHLTLVKSSSLAVDQACPTQLSVTVEKHTIILTRLPRVHDHGPWVDFGVVRSSWFISSWSLLWFLLALPGGDCKVLLPKFHPKFMKSESLWDGSGLQYLSSKLWSYSNGQPLLRSTAILSNLDDCFTPFSLSSILYHLLFILNLSWQPCFPLTWENSGRILFHHLSTTKSMPCILLSAC